MHNSPLYNRSVYNACNRCTATGLERMVSFDHMGNGITIRVFVDNFEQVRCVAFKAGSGTGFAGILLDQYGVIRWKETNPADRGKGYTRQLAGYLSSKGYTVKASEWQTQAGAACYK